MPQNYRDLIAWQKAVRFVKMTYLMTADFPKAELYGLTSQLRRAAVSVPSNIAEGQARHSKVEFRHFLRNARGSLAEIVTQLTIANELGFLSKQDYAEGVAAAEEVLRLVNGLINSISREN